MTVSDIFSRVGIKVEEMIKTALDVGCGNGRVSNALSAKGIQVFAIDLEKPHRLNEKVSFKAVKFEDYAPLQQFDLVFARSVLPFTDDPLLQLHRLLEMGKYALFNVFGPNNDLPNAITSKKEDVLQIIYQQKRELLYSSEEEFEGPNYWNEMRHWHVYSFLVR